MNDTKEQTTNQPPIDMYLKCGACGSLIQIQTTLSGESQLTSTGTKQNDAIVTCIACGTLRRVIYEKGWELVDKENPKEGWRKQYRKKDGTKTK